MNWTKAGTKYLSHLLLGLGFFCHSGLECLAAESEITVDSIFESWKRKQDGVRTVRVVWSEKLIFPKGSLPATGSKFVGQSHPEEDTTVESARTLILDGGLVRATIDGPSWVAEQAKFLPRRYISVYNGTQGKCYYSDSSNGVYPLGYVYKHNQEVELNGILPLLFATRPVDPSMSRFDRKKCQVLGRGGSIQGRPCIILEQSEGAKKLTCWVDPERDYSVLRFAISFSGNKALQMDISYRRDTDHGWVPSDWHTIIVNETTGRLRQDLVATVNDYTINHLVNRDEFELEFPPGTVVEDYVEKERYLMREGGVKRIITTEEDQRGSSYQELLTTESGMAGLPHPARPWLLWLGLTVAVFAALLIRWSVRRKASKVQNAP